jgi:hypothetical protein
MLISANVEAAKSGDKVHLVDDQPYVGREYVGSAPKPGTSGYGQSVVGDGSPQAYLVMQPPGSVTRPHFHQTNQFQVFVDGGGTVGKLRADPITVQYAGANTPGGGGWGNPFARPPELVLRDVRDGVVSRGAAVEDYGVVLTADGRSVDVSATSTERGKRS